MWFSLVLVREVQGISTQIGDDEKQRSACLTAPDKKGASTWHLAREHAREIAVDVARPPSPMTHEIRSRKLAKPWRCKASAHSFVFYRYGSPSRLPSTC